MTPKTYRPKVSIVMSFYKEPLQWIRFALDSIIGQTFRDYELIIVCDNPEYADAVKYIKGIDDGRIRLIINQQNIGPTRSFNTAIASSQGEYIARMDADDICHPERLARQVEYLDTNPDVSMCATDAHTIDGNGKITRRRQYKRKHDQALLIVANCYAHPSVMFRRSLLELRNPIYDEDYTYAQDYELWQFLTLKGCRFHTLDQTLLLYRKSASQISSSKKQSQTEMFKKAHRSFIADWLLTRNVIGPQERTNLKAMLEKSSQAFASADQEDRQYLKYIIYVLYFSLGSIERKYRFLYLIDRNLIVMRIRFIYTYRLLFSRKTRFNRTGLV